MLTRAERSRSSEAEAIAHCQKGLAKYKVPKHFSFPMALPQNGSGKVDRQALKRMVGAKKGQLDASN